MAGDYNGPARAQGTRIVQFYGKIIDKEPLTISRTDNGKAFVQFTIVTSEVVKSAEQPTFTRCTCWSRGESDKYLELVCSFQKDDWIAVHGKLSDRPWTDRNNQPQAGLQIRVDDILTQFHWDRINAAKNAADDDSNYGLLVGASPRAPAAKAADPDAW